MPSATAAVTLPDRYRVVRHIATGGMASVWAAQDELLRRLVAVKVLTPGLAADASARRRFTREARAAARVSDHPHVVTIYDIGEHGDQAFIVMEHFAGGTVGERIRSGEKLPQETILRWLEEAASALDAAHAADIVHRDVKPGNLLLDDRDRLAVGDFGIASLAGETALTQAGLVVGTAAYLSPEQGRGESATPASDRYSLAVVAYELLCGRRPFEGETPAAQLHGHVHLEPPEPGGELCAAAGDALRHGLAKDPAQRPPTAAAFVAELREAIGDAGPATATTRVAGAGAVAARTPRPAPVAAAAGAPAPAAAAPPPPDTPRPMPAGNPGGRARFPLVLGGALATGAVIAVIAAAATGGGDGGGVAAESSGRTAARTTAAERPRTSGDAPRAEQEQPPAAPAAAQEPSTTASGGQGADGRDPGALNDEAFRMLPGNPTDAIPLLQRAVSGFRDQGRTSDRSYAYALYNLGWALRLAGRPDEAIPYLEERLKYPDSTGDAQRELELAREQAGQGGGDDGDGKAKGKKKDD